MLATIIYFYGGRPFLRGTAGELGKRQPGMMTLIALSGLVTLGLQVDTTPARRRLDGASTAPVRKLFCNFRSSGEGPPGSRLTWTCSGCFKELSAACFSRVEVAGCCCSVTT